MELRSRIVALNAPQPITCLDFDGIILLLILQSVFHSPLKSGATVMACCKKNIYQFDSRAKQAQSIVSGNKMGFRQIYFDNCRIITACLDGTDSCFHLRQLFNHLLLQVKYGCLIGEHLLN